MIVKKLRDHLQNFIHIKADQLLVVLIVADGFASWRTKVKISEI